MIISNHEHPHTSVPSGSVIFCLRWTFSSFVTAADAFLRMGSVGAIAYVCVVSVLVTFESGLLMKIDLPTASRSLRYSPVRFENCNSNVTLSTPHCQLISCKSHARKRVCLSLFLFHKLQCKQHCSKELESNICFWLACIYHRPWVVRLISLFVNMEARLYHVDTPRISASLHVCKLHLISHCSLHSDQSADHSDTLRLSMNR